MTKTFIYSTITLGLVACSGQPKTNKAGQEAAEVNPVSVSAPVNQIAVDSANKTAFTGEGADHSKNSAMCGGYTSNRALKPKELSLFRTATAQIDGVSYTPDSVASQVVAGTNYKFTCSARTTTLNPKTYKAEVIIYVPLPHTKKEPRISSITPLN